MLTMFGFLHTYYPQTHLPNRADDTSKVILNLVFRPRYRLNLVTPLSIKRKGFLLVALAFSKGRTKNSRREVVGSASELITFRRPATRAWDDLGVG